MSVNLGAPEDFAADELATIARLAAEDAGESVETATPPPPPVAAPAAPAAAPVAATPAPALEPASTAPAASDSNAPQPQGNVTAALRASRHAEREARRRADELEAELERLRAAAPPPPADGGLTAEELRELQSDLPVVAKLAGELDRLRKQVAAAPAPTAPKPTPGFVPPIQDDPEVQSAIDENPDVLAWQHNPDQVAWKYLCAQENALQSHPVWGAKSLPERLAEATRRVKSELGSTSTPAVQPADAAAAAAAAAAARAPHTLSDIAGGGAPTTPTPGVEQFMKMTDDAIFDMLERSGGG